MPVGSLTVTAQGLYYGPKLLPWNEMKSIEINKENGHIKIRKQGKWSAWASVKLAEVPNAEIFRMLVEHITGVSVTVEGVS